MVIAASEIVRFRSVELPPRAADDFAHSSEIKERATTACPSMLAECAAAFETWSETSPHERADGLLSLADEIEKFRDAFCKTMADEIGATVAWANHNVSLAAKTLRETATYAETIAQGPDPVPNDEVRSYVVKEPLGVCLAITPWNAPLILGVRAVAMALLCGNTVLLKGNELSPKCYQLFGKAIERSDLPDKVVNLFLCATEASETIVETLIASPVVRHVSFTGSTRVGRRVAEISARYLKRPLLELGGQASMIVLEDADLELAAKAAVEGGFLNQGQICMSTERLIVDAPIAEEFISIIEKLRAGLTIGDSRQPDIDLGPLINEESAQRLSGLLSDAVSKGARIVGGAGVDNSFFEPTLIDHVEPEMRLFQEEVFGPILSVTRVNGADEAITIANDSRYGLAASVFSANPVEARRIASQLETGICHINRSTVDDDPHAPFGGMKDSGFGRFGGRWAIDEFTNQRWFTERI